MISHLSVHTDRYRFPTPTLLDDAYMYSSTAVSDYSCIVFLKIYVCYHTLS